MKKIDVALIIITGQLTLSEISALLRRPHSPGSFDKGAARGRRGPSELTLWRFDAGATPTDSVESQFTHISTCLPPESFVRQASMPDDIRTCFDIAVYFDTPMAAVQLSTKCLDIVNKYHASIEVTSYTADFSSGKSEEKGRSPR